MKKEQIVPLVVGAGATATLSWGFEHWFETSRETWPFPGLPVWCPPLDQWLVAVPPAITILIGRKAKKEGIETAGWGGLIYAGANLLRIALIRNVTWRMKGALDNLPITFTPKELQRTKFPYIKEI